MLIGSTTVSREYTNTDQPKSSKKGPTKQIKRMAINENVAKVKENIKKQKRRKRRKNCDIEAFLKF